MSDGQAAEVMSRPLAKGWQWIQLGQYVENLDGRRVPVSQRERDARRGDFPYYGASGVIDSIDGHTHDGEFVLIGEDGANLLTRSKPIAFQAKGKIWVNNHAHVLRCKPGYSNAYLTYYINSIDLSPYVTGTAQPKLSQSMMNKIPVPVAPPAQQVEIVAEIEKQFSRLDEAVANLQRVKANLKRYKAAILKSSVEGRLVETEASLAHREGRCYETGEQLLRRLLEVRRSQWSGRGKYKEPLAHDPCDLTTAPEGWAWCSVDAVSAETLIGLDRGRDQQRTEAVGAPYVKMNNVTMDGDVLTDELVYVDASDEERARFHLASGDLLFNTRNSVELVGKVGIVRTVPAGAVFNNNLMRLRTPDGVSSVFLGYQMCSVGFRQRMEKVKKATTSVAAVYQKDLLPLVVALPPIDEQLRIVAEVDRHLSILRGVAAEVDVNLKRAQALRQATLTKCFAGDVRGLSD